MGRSRESLADRRRYAVQLVTSGYDVATVADDLDVSICSVWRWRKAYREGGEAALKPRKQRPPPLLNEWQRTQLHERLRATPRAYGIDSWTWNIESLQKLIEIEFGILPREPGFRRLVRDFIPTARWFNYARHWRR